MKLLLATALMNKQTNNLGKHIKGQPLLSELSKLNYPWNPIESYDNLPFNG